MLPAKILTEAHSKALNVLHSCVTPYGYRASGLAAGYPQVWARDSAVTFLGAVATGDEQLFTAGRAALETLGKFQTRTGADPAERQPRQRLRQHRERRRRGLQPLVYPRPLPLLHYSGDLAFLRTQLADHRQALRWLDYQDMNECGLLEVPEAGDWMDLLAVRYNVLYDNVLFYAASWRMPNWARCCRPAPPSTSPASTPPASTSGSTC